MVMQQDKENWRKKEKIRNVVNGHKIPVREDFQRTGCEE